MKRGLKYVSYADHSGYGTAGLDYLHGFMNAGHRVSWEPLVFDHWGYVPWSAELGTMPIFRETLADDRGRFPHTSLLDILHADIAYRSIVLHTQPESWPLYWEQGCERVGYTVWESDHVPLHWPALLNTADRILVPCQFNVDVFTHDGVKPPVTVVPHIYRPPDAMAHDEVEEFRRKLGIADNHFVFYTINTWTSRKALWETVTAFLDAFMVRDPVTLVIKTDSTGVPSEDALARMPTPRILAELCAGRRDIPAMHLICRDLSRREIDLLHHLGECYVSLTHGEGWGLGAFEAAGIGNPVIMTGWGGQLDYLGTDHPGLVDYAMVPVRDCFGSGSYQTHQHWAQADRDHAVALMRAIVANPSAFKASAAATHARIRAEFSESAVIHRFAEAIDVTRTA